MQWLYALSLAALITGSACSRSEGGSGASPPAGGGAPPPARVAVEAAGDGKLTTGWSFLGHVQPAAEAEIAAAVAGHVLKVTVREGDKAARGDVLVALDSADVRARVEAARAREAGIETELKVAQRQLERVRGLSYPAVSEPEKERYALAVDSKKAELATQRAEVKRLEVELGHHTVRAPFSGVVRARHVDPGDWLGVGEPVVELVALEELEIHVDVSAELGARLAVGQDAALLGPERAAARVAGIVPALDEGTRTMRVRLAPIDPPAWLIAGMPVNVEFEVSFDGDGVVVSRDALVRGAVDTRVIKLVDGAGVPVPVEVLATAGDRALVRGDGLAAGDQVVVRGNERLRPGQPLEVAP